MSDPDIGDLGAVALALNLPAETVTAAMVRRIEAMRLVRAAGSLDQVRRVLAMAADASALACAGELCQRLPADWHHAAVLAMQVVEVRECERALVIGLMTRDALRAAAGGAGG